MYFAKNVYRQTKLINLLNPIMKLKTSENHFNPDKDKTLQYSFRYIYIFAGILHIAFLIVFYKLDIVEMQWINYFSPLIYFFAFYLNRKGRITLAATIGVSEAIVHGIISLFFISWESNFHIYIILIYFLLFFIYGIDIYSKIVFSALLTIIYAFAYYNSITTGPKYYVPEIVLFVLGIVNICSAAAVLSLFSISYTFFIQTNIGFLKISEKKQRMLNIQINKFFSIFSHDLKNPVTALDNFISMITRKYHTLDDKKKKEYLDQVNQSVGDLRKLVDGLFEWSTSQMENTSIIPRKINVLKTIQDTCSLLANQVLYKKINVTIGIKEELEVYADEQMFRSILRNLLSNAIKFTHEKGEIELNATKENDFIKISLKDNGIGIPQDTLQYIFHLEKKVIRQGTNNETGTGLGLIVVKEFVEKNKGSIEIDSEENIGTTITLSLPTFSQKENETDFV
jgi:signal transduction histidine kinase